VSASCTGRIEHTTSHSDESDSYMENAMFLAVANSDQQFATAGRW